METAPMRFLMAMVLSCTAGGELLGQPLRASRDAAVSIGVLPFSDATGTSKGYVAAALGRTMRAEIADRTRLRARVLQVDVSADALDAEQAAEIGRAQNVDLVFQGTVLEAKAGESTKGGWLPRIKGQQLNVRVRSVNATVTLHGALFDVASGVRLANLRVTGKHSDNKYGGTLWSQLGSWDVGGYDAFLESPLGKALQKAIVEMVKQVDTTQAARHAR